MASPVMPKRISGLRHARRLAMMLRVCIGNVYAEAEIGGNKELINPEYLDTLLNRVTDAAVKAYTTRHYVKLDAAARAEQQ